MSRAFRNSCCIGTLVFAMLVLVPTLSVAQSGDPEPSLISIVVIGIKADMVEDWEDLQKNELGPALQEAGLAFRDIWQTAAFGDTNQYAIVTPIQSYSAYDEPGVLNATLGDAGAARLIAKLRKCVVSRVVYAASARNDLSIPPEGPPKLAVVSTYQVRPGRAEDYSQYLENEIVPVIKQAEGIDGFLVSQTIFGGNPHEWTTLTLIDNYAQIENGPPITRVLDEEQVAELNAKGRELATEVSRIVVRYRGDLSFRNQ